jgi:hypothetical protein
VALASATTPISNAKIGEEKAAAIKSFNERSERCEEYEASTGKGHAAELQATIEQHTASASSVTAQIENLSASLATDNSDLKGSYKEEIGHDVDVDASSSSSDTSNRMQLVPSDRCSWLQSPCCSWFRRTAAAWHRWLRRTAVGSWLRRTAVPWTKSSEPL